MLTCSTQAHIDSLSAHPFKAQDIASIVVVLNKVGLPTQNFLDTLKELENLEHIFSLANSLLHLEEMNLLTPENHATLMQHDVENISGIANYLEKLASSNYAPLTQQDIDNLAACKHQLPDFLDALKNNPEENPRDLLQLHRVPVSKGAGCF